MSAARDDAEVWRKGAAAERAMLGRGSRELQAMVDTAIAWAARADLEIRDHRLTAALSHLRDCTDLLQRLRRRLPA